MGREQRIKEHKIAGLLELIAVLREAAISDGAAGERPNPELEIALIDAKLEGLGLKLPEAPNSAGEKTAEN